MGIRKKFIRRMVLLTILFFCICSSVLTLFFISNAGSMIEVEAQAEGSATQAVIEQFYGSGNLVVLRSQLNGLADSNGWLEASFKNNEGDVVWERATKSSLYPLVGSDFNLSKSSNQTINVRIVGPKVYLSYESAVYFARDYKLGVLSISSDVSNTVKDRMSHLLLLVAVLLGFVVTFVVFANLCVSPILRPLQALKAEISYEARATSLGLKKPGGGDEIDAIRQWFRELSDNWRVAKELAVTNERNAAIAQTTTMLAHDVRKPFSMMTGLLDIVSNSSPDEVKGISEKFFPEVQKAIVSVNGMIADVMEVGANSEPNVGVANLHEIIQDSLIENLRYDKTADISIDYQFDHIHDLQIDALKVSRVFSNVIGNAIQAMKHKGRLWFKSVELNGRVRITIGNSNSYIGQEDLATLFQAFFTKGKSGGTGLGLAIAKKVVTAHGGRIWCTSDRLVGTEFHFTLPISQVVSQTSIEMPRAAKSIRGEFETSLFRNAANDISLQNSELKIENENKTAEHKKIKVLICDDEAVYRNIVSSYVEQSSEAKSKIQIISANDGEAAIEAIKHSEPTVIVMDVDLGAGKINGFETVRKIREAGSKAKICIHSNRGAMEYQKSAWEAGADLFIPKPMGRAQFLNIVLGVASSGRNNKTNGSSELRGAVV